MHLHAYGTALCGTRHIVQPTPWHYLPTDDSATQILFCEGDGSHDNRIAGKFGEVLFGDLANIFLKMVSFKLTNLNLLHPHLDTEHSDPQI